MSLLDRFKSRMIDPERALPGRDQAMPVPERHEVLGNPSPRPSPKASSRPCSGWAASGAPSGCSGRHRGVWTTAVGYAGGYTPNPTYQEVCSGSTGHTEAVLVVFDPAQIELRRDLLKIFWEGHDPTQGMRQGNDMGSQYRSGIYYTSPEQQAAAEQSRAMYQERLSASGYGEITTEIADGPPVLLRRGLPPAVPREEPRRVLRRRRHRGQLPRRRPRRRVATSSAGPGTRRASGATSCPRRPWRAASRDNGPAAGGACRPAPAR